MDWGSDLCIFKIKCGQVLRRIIVKVYGDRPDMTFRQLESTIRTQFKLPVSSEFAIVYTDTENEVVTMANDDDIKDACVIQKLNPLHLTVLPQAEEEESRSSAHDARPPEPLIVDPPPWAADILLKLDQLLLAVNKPLVEPHVAPRSPASTKIEDHFVVVDDSPIDDSTLKKMEERFLVVGESSIAGPTIEHAKDAAPSKERTFANAQSESDFELQRRAMILLQRLMTEEVSEVVGRGSKSTGEAMV